MPPKQRPKNPKVCERCGKEYLPRSGAQRKCDTCRAMKPKLNIKRRKPAIPPTPPEKPSRSRAEEKRRIRGRELRNSEIAFEAEARLIERIGPMRRIKDETD